MTGPPPDVNSQHGFAQRYADRPVPHLTEVNTMTCPQALAWYHANGYHVRPQIVTPGGTRRLAGLAPGYSFDDLEPLTEAEVGWLAANWRPEWRLGMIMGKGSGLFALDADDAEQWKRFAAEHQGEIAPTAWELSGGDGFRHHLIYRRPDGWNDYGGDLALKQGSWSDKYPNIEVKSRCALTVAPSVHYRSGRLAQWRADGEAGPGWPYPELMASRRKSIRDLVREMDLEKERDRRAVRREADAEEEAAARGDRKDMSWPDLTALPKPVWIYQRMLTQGFHGLAGPPEAGKSLLARNWCCEIAAAGRGVLYALSEGQFDLADRFGAHPLIADAGPRLWFLDAYVNLASPSDVAWLCETYAARAPALVVFDMIYGFGLPDDNGVQGVAPVIGGCKRIAAELGCAVLAVGHPNLTGDRRFRGSSMWRGSFDSEWHMGDGQVSCEKHKYADRRQFQWPYQVQWPDLRLLGDGELLSRENQRLTVIAGDFAMFPKDADAVRARRIAGTLGVGQDRARALIRIWRSSQM